MLGRLHRELAGLFDSGRAQAERLTLGSTITDSSRLASVEAWSSPSFSRAVLSTIDLAPVALRLELVAIPRGPVPTLVVRLAIDSLGVGHLLFDGFGPGQTKRGNGRHAFAKLAADFRAASAVLGESRTSPRWIASLSSGGGVVISRDIDALAREARELVTTALAVAHDHRNEDRDQAFDASHRTAADALRAHDRMATLVRLRLGSAFSARFDALRFADC